MKKIRVALIGVGNCVSSLVQGVYFYKDKNSQDGTGLMHWDLGGYKPFDIEFSAAFDIDRRKVGKDLSKAIFEAPNCTTIFCDKIPDQGVPVKMGRILDGYSDHMQNYEDSTTFLVSDKKEATQEEVVKILKETKTEIMLNFLPVGSEKAAKFYAECALEANVALINCIPVFIASDPEWADRFKEKNLPIIGDDIKAQIGATITHRTLTELFLRRGVKIERTYQLNTGGNTDFLNMLNRDRLKSKKISKTDAVQSIMDDSRLDGKNIHIGPSDYVPWQKDNKVCFIRMEGKTFGDIPVSLEMRLSVEDSPNSAGVVIDAIRCCKVALIRGQGGPIDGPSSYFMKHPPRQFPDSEAFKLTEKFINKEQVEKLVAKQVDEVWSATSDR